MSAILDLGVKIAQRKLTGTEIWRHRYQKVPFSGFRIVFKKITLESVLEKLHFRPSFSPYTCGRGLSYLFLVLKLYNKITD